MDQLEQQKAIAELLGWKFRVFDDRIIEPVNPDGIVMTQALCYDLREAMYKAGVPDYLRDREAIVSAMTAIVESGSISGGIRPRGEIASLDSVSPMPSSSTFEDQLVGFGKRNKQSVWQLSTETLAEAILRFADKWVD